MGIQNVSHAYILFDPSEVVSHHLNRDYPDGTGSGSGSGDEREKDHSKDDFLEAEFRKRRRKVWWNCDPFGAPFGAPFGFSPPPPPSPIGDPLGVLLVIPLVSLVYSPACKGGIN